MVNSLTHKRPSQLLSSLCYLSPFAPFTGAPKILYCNCLCRISPLGLWDQKMFYSILRWTNAKHIKTHKKCILHSFFWSLNQVFLRCVQISVSKFSIWPDGFPGLSFDKWDVSGSARQQFLGSFFKDSMHAICHILFRPFLLCAPWLELKQPFWNTRPHTKDSRATR